MALVDLGKSSLDSRGRLWFFVPQEDKMAIRFQGTACLGIGDLGRNPVDGAGRENGIKGCRLQIPLLKGLVDHLHRRISLAVLPCHRAEV